MFNNKRVGRHSKNSSLLLECALSLLEENRLSERLDPLVPSEQAYRARKSLSRCPSISLQFLSRCFVHRSKEEQSQRHRSATANPKPSTTLSNQSTPRKLFKCNRPLDSEYFLSRYLSRRVIGDPRDKGIQIDPRPRLAALANNSLSPSLFLSVCARVA